MNRFLWVTLITHFFTSVVWISLELINIIMHTRTELPLDFANFDFAPLTIFKIHLWFVLHCWTVLTYTGNMLFFGCRSERADFFFSSEWKPLASSEHLKLYTAFSRDQEAKVYVQHRIKEHGTAVWEWLSKKKGSVLIAGWDFTHCHHCVTHK